MADARFLALARSSLVLGDLRLQTGQDQAGPGQPELGQVVAKVDDAVITVGDVQDRINKQSPFVRARYTTHEKKKEFLDSLIRFEVMADEAAAARLRQGSRGACG